MPPDLPNEQELTLKKRARRRLVGAIALVLLMVIVLPQVLQDRAALSQQEPIKITMPVVANATPEPTFKTAAVESPVEQQLVQHEVSAKTASETELSTDVKDGPDVNDTDTKKPTAETVAVKIVDNKLANDSAPLVQIEKKVEAKTAETNKPDVKTPIRQKELFTVQVGVYSDAANVKRLQEQLKQAGFSTHTEKVKTPKGESIRLKAGSYGSRQDAVAALAKLKEIGLSGIVIGNE